MTTAIMPVIVNGKSYLASDPADTSRPCGGCAGQKDTDLCHALPSCSGGNFEGIIFIDAHGPALPAEPAVPTLTEFGKGYAAGMAAKQAEWTRFEEQRAAAAAEYITRPLARSLDPTTSKQAARDMNRKAGRIADLVLLTLRDCNQTGKQLAAATGVALNSITPRFAQLSRKGLIHAAGGNGRETVWALGNGVAAAPSVSPSLFESI